MRFLERKPLIGTWVAIVALTAHDVINIAIVTTFGVVHRIDDGFVRWAECLRGEAPS